MIDSFVIRPVKQRIAFFLAVAGLLLAPATRASTIAVTDFVDDANLANGTCTLREAIRAANNDVAVDGCPAGQSAFVDEILVPPGVHFINLASGNDEDLSVTGDLDIRGPVRIRGAASEYSIIDGGDPGAVDRLIQIHDLADDVLIERVTLRGGNAADTSKRGGVLWNQVTGPNDVELVEVEIRGGIAGSGGGIFNEGNLNIQRSQIFDNHTTVVPGTAGNHGGGIASSGPSAQLRVEDSEIRNNSAEEDGAGLWIAAGDFVMYRSSLTDNVAGLAGGGLHVASNGYDVQYVEFARNRAAAGGGVYLEEQGEIQRSAFIANQATATGGAVHDAFGGFVRFSTLTQNSAPLGGAVYADTAQTLLDSDTIAANAGGGVHNQSGVFFENTLLSANAGGNCTGNPPAFGAFNLDSANSCGFVSTPAAPNLSSTQPLLGPLADNGGPTQTLALLPGSPAIDVVTSEIRTNCQNMFDQRGYPRGRPRTQNGLGEDVFLCDIGAYEATASFVVNTLADGVDANLADDRCATSGGGCTLRAAIQQANAIVGMNEISLGAGTHLISIAGTGEDASLSGDFDIVPPVVIRGVSASLSTVAGGALDRVFHVGPLPPSMSAAPSWTFFRDLSITGGDAGSDNGGGIATRSPIRIERVRLADNDGQLGSAISTSPTGFFFLTDLAPVEVFDSTVENNLGGGAVFIKDAVVDRSSLIDNVANSGNGGAGEFGRVELRSSTVSGNEAPAQGAFFANTALIDSSTIYDNTAVSDTGGVYLLEFSILRNSIMANNRAGGLLQNCSMNPGGITTLGYNLTDGDGVDCGLDNLMSDQVNTNPTLGVLANNGGPTRTHLPLPGSPAIDRGDPTGCATTDQRGVPRPLDGDTNGSFICDVGSVEVPEPRRLMQIVAGGLALVALARRRKGTRQRMLFDPRASESASRQIQRIANASHTGRVARLGRTLMACLIMACSIPVSSAFAQSVVSASPDVTIQLGPGNLVTTDHSVAVDNQLGIVALQNLGAIPGSADVTGYADAGGGTFLFSLDTTVSFPSGVVARPNDVVAWNGVTHSIRFDGSTQGVPNGVRIDAISLAVNNGLVLSFDTDVRLPGGVDAADEDLVKFAGGGFAIVLDGSSVGVARSLDIDGAQDIGGGYLVSFDTAGTVDSIPFQDEDILRYAGGTWSMAFDASTADADWGAADLDALQVPEPDVLAMLAAGIFALVVLRRRRAGVMPLGLALAVVTVSPRLSRPPTSPPTASSRSIWNLRGRQLTRQRLLRNQPLEYWNLARRDRARHRVRCRNQRRKWNLQCHRWRDHSA